MIAPRDIAAPTSQSGTRMLRAVALVSAVVLGMSAAACTATGDVSHKASRSPQPSPSRYPEPPDGGVVKVVEKGFSVIDGQEPMVSYATVLQNTSKLVAVRTSITLRLLNSSGKPVRLRYQGDWEKPEPSPYIKRGAVYIMPGERLAIGGVRYRYSAKERIASLEVRVRNTDEWRPVNSKAGRFCPLKASNVDVRRTTKSLMLVSFDITGMGAGCDKIDKGAFFKYYGLAVYRDRNGKLMGAQDTLRVEPVTQEFGERVRGQMQIWAPVPAKDQVDDGRTEVHLRMEMALPAL